MQNAHISPVATRTAELLALREAEVPRGLATRPIFIAKGQNAEMWDVDGRRLIDFGSGIAVLNTGHMHPRVKAAVVEQLELFSHTCFQVTPYENYLRLAERLNRLVPGPTDKKTLFLSSGAEALENAVKIARAHTGRQALVAFSGGFHGRTMLAMSMTGKVYPYKAGFGPMFPDVYHLPFPVAYHGVTEDDAWRALEQLFKADLEVKRCAAIAIEPVQGEGGFYIAPKSFMQHLRAFCDEHGIVLIIDEVQSGFARTGKLFAIEHYDIEPDLITLAKSLAGGFPLSAVTGKAHIMDAPMPGGLGGTYAGSPIACAAAHAVLDVIEDEGLNARAVAIGLRLTTQLHEMASEPELAPSFGEVRGLGAMVAVELVENGDANKPAAVLTAELVRVAADNGLILLGCGVRSNVIRFLVALTASDALVDEGMAIFRRTLRQVLHERID